MFADDSVADAQAEAGSLPYFLGSEEWIKDAVRIGNTVAVIAERDLDEILQACGHDFNTRQPAGLAYRVIGIVNNVKEDLLQLMGIANHIGQILIEELDHIDAMTGEVIRAQLHSANENGVELHWFALRRILARETEQVLHDLLGALRFLKNHS